MDPPEYALVRQDAPGRLPTPLVDRNIILDELMQMKKELKAQQMETRRINDELSHKLAVVDARLQATESVSRTLDKREQANSGTVEKQLGELELKLREAMHEVSRIKRTSDSGMQIVNTAAQKDQQQRDGHLQQLDGLARALVTRLKTVEEDMVTVVQKVFTELDKRGSGLQTEINKGDHQTLEKLLQLQRVLEREADERARGDVEIRQELSEVLLAVKHAAAQEAAQRVSMQKELRTDLDAATKELTSTARAMREETERSKHLLSDRVQEVRAQNEAATGALQRQMEQFSRFFEAERGKQQRSVQEAVAQMLERTSAVQRIAKEMEGDGQQVKAIALRVQEATNFGLSDLSGKLRDAIASNRAANAKQERLVGELRESVLAEVQEAVEESSGRVAESLRKEGDESRSRLQGAVEELRAELYGQRQRLQGLEMGSELRLSAALSDLQAAQGQVVEGLRQQQEFLGDASSRMGATLREHTSRLDALEHRPPAALSHRSPRAVEILKPGAPAPAIKKGFELDATKPGAALGPPQDMGYLSKEFSLPIPRQAEKLEVVSFQHLGADSLPSTPMAAEARPRSQASEPASPPPLPAAGAEEVEQAPLARAEEGGGAAERRRGAASRAASSAHGYEDDEGFEDYAEEEEGEEEGPPTPPLAEEGAGEEATTEAAGDRAAEAEEGGSVRGGGGGSREEEEEKVGAGGGRVGAAMVRPPFASFGRRGASWRSERAAEGGEASGEAAGRGAGGAEAHGSSGRGKEEAAAAVARAGSGVEGGGGRRRRGQGGGLLLGGGDGGERGSGEREPKAGAGGGGGSGPWREPGHDGGGAARSEADAAVRSSIFDTSPPAKPAADDAVAEVAVAPPVPRRRDPSPFVGLDEMSEEELDDGTMAGGKPPKSAE